MRRAITYKIHPQYPQPYLIGKVAEAIRRGAVVLYPTDTVYAIGCHPGDKDSIERLRALKPQSQNLALTLLSPSLSDMTRYTYLEDDAFKLMKALTPGPFTFILKATKMVPKLVQNPKRKTAGVRIPSHPICQALLAELGEPLVTTSARMPDGTEPQSEWELFEALAPLVDVIVDDELPMNTVPSTVLDLSEAQPVILREGAGLEKLAPFMQD